MVDFADLTAATDRDGTDEIAVTDGTTTERMPLSVLLAGLLKATPSFDADTGVLTVPQEGGTDLAVDLSALAGGSMTAQEIADAIVGGATGDIAFSTAGTGAAAKLQGLIAPGKVDTIELADDAVTAAKVADDAVGVAALSAGGAPSASTFLRGDNRWAAPAGGGSGTAVAAHTPAAGDDELTGLDIAGADYEIVDAEARDRLATAEHRIHPIREVDQTWTDVSDGAAAGWAAPTTSILDVSGAAALTYGVTAVAGDEDDFVYVRIPVGAQQSRFRFAWTPVGGRATDSGRGSRVLGTWAGERIGADTSWQYYRVSFYAEDSFTGGRVQSGEGVYEWEAALTQAAVYERVKAILQAGSNVTVTPDDDDGELTVAASGSGGGSQRSRQDTIDLLVGDTGGDVDFTRDGSGSSSDLRGALRAGSVGSAEIAGSAVTGGKIASSAVTAAKLASNAVTNAKLADDAVGVAELSASGTPSASTFLRGDNSWAEPEGGADAPTVVGSAAVKVEADDDQAVVKLRAPDLHSGFWGRGESDDIVPVGSDDPAEAVPARLTEVRSNDTRTTARLSDVVYEKDDGADLDGTFEVPFSTELTLDGFGSGRGYDAAKPGFVWDEANDRFHHNGVAATVANSGSNTNKFKLRFEVDYKHHVVAHNAGDPAHVNFDLIVDLPLKFGVDRTHTFRVTQPDSGAQVTTATWTLDIQSSEAPATTDHLVVKMQSKTTLGTVGNAVLIDAVRVHFILPDSANVDYTQEYDLSNAVTWVGRNLLGPALGSHTNNQTAASVKIVGGRLVATADLASLELDLNARTGVAGNGHNIRLMTRVPGLTKPTVLHEWDDSTNVWRVVRTLKHVVAGQEVWVEADSGATYSSVGSPNIVWDASRHDSDEADVQLYPGLIKVLTQAQYDALSWVNPYQVYFIEAAGG